MYLAFLQHAIKITYFSTACVLMFLYEILSVGCLILEDELQYSLAMNTVENLVMTLELMINSQRGQPSFFLLSRSLFKCCLICNYFRNWHGD